MNSYPLILNYKDHKFHKKECSECSATFWHISDQVTYCGSSKCNTFQESINIKNPKLTLPILIEDYYSHFLNYKNELFRKVNPMIRPKLYVKHSTTDMSFLCAGVTAYESLSIPDSPRLEYFSRDLFVSNTFCFRFLDKYNVGSTKTHSTGFFMAGLHCFEGKYKFEEDWKSKGVTVVLSYFIECLKLKASCIYLHADSWSDGKKGGPSIEFYINGLEVGNCVFTQRDIEAQTILENRYLDVGVGIERILKLITEKDSIYFNNPKYDHLRTFIMGYKDNLYPSKIGVGYNIRKLCEEVLKYYKKEMIKLESDLKIINAELALILPNENFQEKEITGMMAILNDELNRCITSHIL